MKKLFKNLTLFIAMLIMSYFPESGTGLGYLILFFSWILIVASNEIYEEL